MIRHPLRPIFGAVLVLCLALGCSEPAPPKAPAGLSPEQSQQIKQSVDALQARVVLIAQQIDMLTSESQSLLEDVNGLQHQLGGKVVGVAGVRPVPAAKAAPAEGGKGPLGPLVRLLLIVIILFALWIIARIFLGRLGEEEEDDEDFALDGGDEEILTEEGTIRISPEAHAPAAQPQEPPKNEAHDEGDSSKI